MIVSEEPNLLVGTHFINPSGLGDWITENTLRPIQREVCDSNLTHCPKCTESVRKTRSYIRTIDYLTKTIQYEVVYYYCDECALGWPSIPPCALPNISVGIDVLGHISYWHIVKGQSFKTVIEHLWECHGIRRAKTTIQAYISRFHILKYCNIFKFHMKILEHSKSFDLVICIFL